MAQQSTRLPSGKAMLYNFLLNELLASHIVEGYTFWVLSPWVTNFALEHPYYVAFSELVSTRHEELHIFDVFRQIAANGGQVRITVGSDVRYYAPLRVLRDQSARIEVRVYRSLHAKAYAGHFGAVIGSLNLTDSGVHHNAELYGYFHDQHSIAQVRQCCIEHFERGEPLL